MAKIHLQFTLFSAFYSPLISTMTGGFLAEEGFDYEWSVAEPGVSALKALEMAARKWCNPRSVRALRLWKKASSRKPGILP